MNCAVITHNHSLTIDDTPLTPIVKMRHGVCRYLYFVSRWPILSACIATTNWRSNYLIYERTICWSSIDTHFKLEQGVCRLLCFLWRQPLPHFWIATTNRPSDYPEWKTANCWCSVDAHFTTDITTIWYIWFSIGYHWWCFGSLSTVFMYFLLYHYIVL